jgi:DNA-binding transcriptional MerR regulator
MLENKNKLLSISEVAEMFGLKNPKTNKLLNHSLRFWETKFKQLKPAILAGGRRYYSKKNIEIVRMIIFLLKEQGLTINGAIKVMNNKRKELDDAKTLSIKGEYYKKNIKFKSNQILKKIKKLNGKKVTYQS